MRRIDVAIIGAGHAGLAMSRYLASYGIDHVILERGEVANSWRTERWDSLKLLTPNWQSRLPGYRYCGDDPDGYRSMDQVIDFIDGYARAIDAPVKTQTRVLSVRSLDGGYQVKTDGGDWACRALVLASGACNIACLPTCAKDVPKGIATLTSMQYRNPDQLEDGGVMVVGASATGLQLAEEIQASGRQVTLAIGEHVRVPRKYRGRDIKYWMDRAGVLDERFDQVDDINRARRVPSLQLIGSADQRSLDINALKAAGVEIVGRLAGINGARAQFSGSLANQCAMADLKQGRLLDTIDQWIGEQGLDGEVGAADRPAATDPGREPPLGMDLTDGRIKTIVWATGYRPDYSWLDLPVLDRKGRIVHDGGVVAAPGLYVMGLAFLRRRKSSLIDGAGDDARDLSRHLSSYLGGLGARAAA
jgi:putative flavoprotein involved in K+ transport